MSMKALRSLILPAVLMASAVLPAGAAQGAGKNKWEPPRPVKESVSVPLLTSGACTISSCDPDAFCFQESPAACVEQTCKEVSWRVCLQDRGKKGLWVGPVDLKRSPESAWMRVFHEAGLVEILVPYHNGTHLRDMQHCPPVTHPDRCHRVVQTLDAGPGGALLTLKGDTAPRAVVESRDRGVAWLCKWKEKDLERFLVRRGEEMVLWGVYDTGNYDYLIEYGFRDDGTIAFRLGATGWNNNNFPSEAHMHTGLWRLDIDLNDPTVSNVKLTNHREGALSRGLATDLEVAFSGGKEGGTIWIPGGFTTLVVEDEAVNAHGNHLSYELVPLRRGIARHYGGFEQFTQRDFWVTVFHPEERGYLAPNDWHTNGTSPDNYLITSATHDGQGNPNPESIANQDVVIWYLGGEHHDPHDEDQAAGDASGEMKGVTLMHWLGFDLVPHNLFDHNPLGGPHRQDCDGPL